MIYLYRTMQNDDDGDPMDHGIVRAKSRKRAVELVFARLKALGCNDSIVRFYPSRAPKAQNGIFTDAGDTVDFNPATNTLHRVRS